MDTEILLPLAIAFNIILFFLILRLTNNLTKFMSFYMHENGIKVKEGDSNIRFLDKDGRDIEMIEEQLGRTK